VAVQSTRHFQHGEVDGAGAGLHYDGGRVVSTRSDGPSAGERIVRLRAFGDQECVEIAPLLSAAAEADNATPALTDLFAL